MSLRQDLAGQNSRVDHVKDRASAGVRDCRNLAQDPEGRCSAPFAARHPSDRSCLTLDGIFAALDDVLQLSYNHHACAQDGFCVHERWHAESRNSRKNSLISRISRRFRHAHLKASWQAPEIVDATPQHSRGLICASGSGLAEVRKESLERSSTRVTDCTAQL
ncbi:hypothetical protein B0H17DRAFT_1208768 [Mycena rosella]|uniref:Uncharacterized protein n=1 Tax=Mycena rosella TaxID=1033263 RepID=A0AAD7D009_MYCRO|nr:hypothetical protein B0H17DRAFT_1208768 [Mycena rosella]